MTNEDDKFGKSDLQGEVQGTDGLVVFVNLGQKHPEMGHNERLPVFKTLL